MVSLKERLHRDPVPIELVRPSFYGMLVCYYSGLLTFGVFAVFYQSKSLILVGGDRFAFEWAILFSTAAFVAIVGVTVTRLLDVGWYEWAATIILVSMFAGLSAALLIRGITVPDQLGSISFAVLPLVICVLPGWRIAVMVVDRTVIFKWFKKRAINNIEKHFEKVDHYK